MERKLYAVCPKCGKRAGVTGIRWDWDAQQDFAKLRCVCGTAERARPVPAAGRRRSAD